MRTKYYKKNILFAIGTYIDVTRIIINDGQINKSSSLSASDRIEFENIRRNCHGAISLESQRAGIRPFPLSWNCESARVIVYDLHRLYSVHSLCLGSQIHHHVNAFCYNLFAFFISSLCNLFNS